MAWSPEQVKLLLQLLDYPDLSADDIAIRIGGGLTRSAVLGKIHRDKLAWCRNAETRRSQRQQKALNKRLTAKAKRLQRTEKQRAFNPIANPEGRDAAIVAADGWTPPVDPIEPGPLLTLADLPEGACKAPYGGGDEPVMFGCIHPRVPGTSYCLGHAKRFLNLPDPRTARKLAALADIIDKTVKRKEFAE